MSSITTHVLDLTRGLPAAGVGVELERKQQGGWQLLANRHTDADGRARDLIPPDWPLEPGTYRLRFLTGDYFSSGEVQPLHPWIEIVFDVRNANAHYHIPLLVTPHGYSTYRGS